MEENIILNYSFPHSIVLHDKKKNLTRILGIGFGESHSKKSLDNVKYLKTR